VECLLQLYMNISNLIIEKSEQFMAVQNLKSHCSSYKLTIIRKSKNSNRVDRFNHQ